MNTSGYHQNPEASAALIDADGWVHTGDIGEIDDDGFLKVVDRKKEMIITSSGKNIAPSNIENLLKESPLVGHALAYGEGKPYVVAILTLDPDVAPVVAGKLGLEYADLADLAQNAGDPRRRRPGRRQGQRAALPSRAGQEVEAAAGRVDRRVRRADPDAEAQAPRRAQQLRRRARGALLVLNSTAFGRWGVDGSRQALWWEDAPPNGWWVSR